MGAGVGSCFTGDFCGLEKLSRTLLVECLACTKGGGFEGVFRGLDPSEKSSARRAGELRGVLAGFTGVLAGLLGKNSSRK